MRLRVNDLNKLVVKKETSDALWPLVPM